MTVPNGAVDNAKFLLTRGCYDVFIRVPNEWGRLDKLQPWIAAQLRESDVTIGKRLAYLMNTGLVERRRSPRIEAWPEIRKTAGRR